MVGGTQKERQRLQELLRHLRKKAGLRQIDLAERLNRPQSYVSKYELGEKSLDLLEIKELCLVLGIPLVEFIQLMEKTLHEGKP